MHKSHHIIAGDRFQQKILQVYGGGGFSYQEFFLPPMALIRSVHVGFFPGATHVLAMGADPNETLTLGTLRIRWQQDIFLTAPLLYTNLDPEDLMWGGHKGFDLHGKNVPVIGINRHIKGRSIEVSFLDQLNQHLNLSDPYRLQLTLTYQS